MQAQHTTLSLFVIESSGIIIYCEKQPKGMNIPFQQGMFEHMEVCNYETLCDLISQACVSLGLKDTACLFALGKSLYFEKQVPLLPEEKLQMELDSFKESTPFERTAAHYYKNAQGTLLVSINRDFYDTLRQILDKNDVGVIGIIPQFILAELLGSAGIQAKTFSALFAKADDIAQQSIITHKFIPRTLQEQQEYISKQYSGAVIVVFIIFIVGVIGGTAYILRSQSQANRPKAPIVTLAPVATPAEIQSDTLPVPQESTAPLASASALRIVIIYAPEVATKAAQLQKNLQSDQYTQASVKQQSGLRVSEPLVLFKPTTAEGNRQQIIAQIKQLFPTVSIQEQADLDTDIRITIGK